MPHGFTRTPKLLKGALVHIEVALVVPVPRAIVFQYNPEGLSRSLTPFDPAGEEEGRVRAGGTSASGTHGQPWDPTETFDLTLFLDASDDLEEGRSPAVTSGVADRIAALEQLVYPVRRGLIGNLVGSAVDAIASRTGSGVRTIPERFEVPVVLFVWGPGRVLPVRLTRFSVEEQQHNHLLYPHRARVSLTLRVLTADALDREGGSDAAKELAKVCYRVTQRRRESLASSSVAAAASTIRGLIPI